MNVATPIWEICRELQNDPRLYKGRQDTLCAMSANFQMNQAQETLRHSLLSSRQEPMFPIRVGSRNRLDWVELFLSRADTTSGPVYLALRFRGRSWHGHRSQAQVRRPRCAERFPQ